MRATSPVMAGFGWYQAGTFLLAAIAWAGYAGQMMMLSFDGPAVRVLPAKAALHRPQQTLCCSLAAFPICI